MTRWFSGLQDLQSLGGGAGSSLAAVRSVLQDVHVVDGAKSETDSNAAATTASAIVADTVRRKVKKKNKVQAVQEWPCDGPGCCVIMRCKTEWQKYYNKYYCKACYHSDNCVPRSR